MSGRWRERARRVRYAARWAWSGKVRARHRGVTFVCEHMQPGDVMVVMTAYRNVEGIGKADGFWKIAGSTQPWKALT